MKGGNSTEIQSRTFKISIRATSKGETVIYDVGQL